MMTEVQDNIVDGPEASDIPVPCPMGGCEFSLVISKRTGMFEYTSLLGLHLQWHIAASLEIANGLLTMLLKEAKEIS